ncbi:hypothetical protein MMC22_004397 [Lobaria immixta]|nr:hypothetical protein [Lobaria immixta]
MPENILAIYDNVEPNLELTLPQRRDMALSEESTGFVESDDCDRNAFHIFHQFAAPMYYKGDYQDEIEIAMSDTDEWADTGFAIVSNVIQGDLGQDYELKLDHKLANEPELVKVFGTPDGLLLKRITDKDVQDRVVS